MSNFLQFHASERQRDGGFFDTLIEEYEAYQKNPASIGNKLKDQVQDWLVDDKKLTRSVNPAKKLKPQDIADAISNRVCDIAGHVWLEFVMQANDGSIRGTEYSQKPGQINAHLAEFIPELPFDAILEALDTRSAGPMPWSSVTNKKLLDLLTPILRESTIARKANAGTPRLAAGCLPGYMNLITPDDLRRQGDSWFEDRNNSYITPVWPVDDPNEIIDAINDIEAGAFYSFTPDQYEDADNCVTWALRTLDSLIADDSLEIIRVLCDTPPQCGHKDPLPHDDCESLHIRSQGRMRCIVNYVFEANKKR